MCKKYIFCIVLTTLAAAFYTGCEKTAESDTMPALSDITQTEFYTDDEDDWNPVTTTAAISEAYSANEYADYEFEEETQVTTTVTTDDTPSVDDILSSLNMIESDGFPYPIEKDTPASVAVFNEAMQRYYCLLNCQYMPNVTGKKISGDFTQAMPVFENDDYKIVFNGIHESNRSSNDNVYAWLNDMEFIVENKTSEPMIFSMLCNSVNCLSVYSADKVKYGNLKSTDTGNISIPAESSATYRINIDIPSVYRLEDIQSSEKDFDSFILTYTANNKIRYLGMYATEDGIVCNESNDMSDVCRVVNRRWYVDGYKTFVQGGNYGSIADIYYYSQPDSNEQVFRLKMGFVNNHFTTQSVSIKFKSVNGVDLAVSDETSITIAPCSFAMGDIATTFINSSKTVKSARIEVNTGGFIKEYNLDFITNLTCDELYTNSDYFNKDYMTDYYVPGMILSVDSTVTESAANDLSGDNESDSTDVSMSDNTDIVITESDDEYVETTINMDLINSVLR